METLRHRREVETIVGQLADLPSACPARDILSSGPQGWEGYHPHIRLRRRQPIVGIG